MKRLLKVSVAVTLFFLVASPGFSQTGHIGLWKGIDKGEVGYINLDSLGFAYFIISGDTLGGESFIMNDQQAYMKYEINYSKPLKSLDFILCLKADNQEIGRLPGIFKFDENNNLVLCISFENDGRPMDFNEDNTILLEKIDAAQ